MNSCIVTEIAKNPYTYNRYRDLVFELTEKGGNTGEILPERISATKLNAQRIKRIDKQTEISSEIKNALLDQKREWKWMVLLESWCGDGAQNIPIIAKIAGESTKIELEIILRDENPEIMDAYLTNNSRAIPKLICLDKETGEEIGVWGPRPKAIQQAVLRFKTLNPDVSHDDFVAYLHALYTKDKGNSLQQEFLELIKLWNK